MVISLEFIFQIQTLCMCILKALSLEFQGSLLKLSGGRFFIFQKIQQAVKINDFIFLILSYKNKSVCILI